MEVEIVMIMSSLNDGYDNNDPWGVDNEDYYNMLDRIEQLDWSIELLDSLLY